MTRLSDNAHSAVTELRDEIDSGLSNSSSFGSGDGSLWEQETEIPAMLAEIDGALETLASEGRRERSAWTSHFEAIDELRGRITALSRAWASDTCR